MDTNSLWVQDIMKMKEEEKNEEEEVNISDDIKNFSSLSSIFC